MLLIKNYIKKSLLIAGFFNLLSISEASDKINSFYYDFRSQYVQRFINSLDAYAKGHDVELDKYDGKTNANLQLTQIYSVINTREPLLINLIDPKLAQNVIDHVKPYGNRVVFFNRKPSQPILDSYKNAFFVGTKGESSGQAQFEIISDYIDYTRNYDRNKNGYLDVIFLQGEENSPDADGRTSKILKLFDERKILLNVISKNHDNWLAQVAYDDLKNQISRVGANNVDMIIANNDVMAIGAVKFLNTIGYNTGESNSVSHYIPVFGVDGIPEAIELIKSNKMTGTVFADFSALAKVATILATESLTDEDELTRKTWYKVKNKSVLIPFVKFSDFKDYSKRTYPISFH